MNLHRYSPKLKGRAAALLMMVVAWLTGCVAVPAPIREVSQQGPEPGQVQSAPEQYTGVTVRWGGVIVDVENGPERSEVEVVSRPLGDDARPRDTDQTYGRFLARINDFIDPMDYVPGREITVVGVVEGVEQRNIGERRYAYPIVRATGYYLWPLRPPPTPDYYYPPFYDPWYPFGLYYYPYPYYYPRYPRYVPQPYPRPRPRPLQQPRQQREPFIQRQPQQQQPQPGIRPRPFRN